MRRRMRKRPRRFSRQFIISQLNKRNEYRCTIRMLQNNPHLSVATNFPHHVNLPIRVGTTVTAFSKRFRIIQRGKVLTYDRNTALYLIEFESKQFGFELCPDSDVATCGIPEVLIRCTKDRLVGRPTCIVPNQPTPGSSIGPLQGQFEGSVRSSILSIYFRISHFPCCRNASIVSFHAGGRDHPIACVLSNQFHGEKKSEW